MTDYKDDLIKYLKQRLAEHEHETRDEHWRSMEEHIIDLEVEILNLQCCGNCSKYYDEICLLDKNKYKYPNEACDQWTWDKLHGYDRVRQ